MTGGGCEPSRVCRRRLFCGGRDDADALFTGGGSCAMCTFDSRVRAVHGSMTALVGRFRPPPVWQRAIPARWRARWSWQTRWTVWPNLLVPVVGSRPRSVASGCVEADAHAGLSGLYYSWWWWWCGRPWWCPAPVPFHRYGRPVRGLVERCPSWGKGCPSSGPAPALTVDHLFVGGLYRAKEAARSLSGCPL